jgi:hypothetical protein
LRAALVLLAFAFGTVVFAGLRLFLFVEGGGLAFEGALVFPRAFRRLRTL